MTTITRLGYCEKCAKEHAPKTEQLFLAVGSSKCCWKALKAKRNGRAGFVPHLYKLRKVTDQKVYYQRLCAMDGCGTFLVEEDGKSFLVPNESLWSTWKATSLSNWNALVLFKDTGFEI